MKKVFNIYDISSGDGVFIQTVTCAKQTTGGATLPQNNNH